MTILIFLGDLFLNLFTMDPHCLKCNRSTTKDKSNRRNRLKVTEEKKSVKLVLSKLLKIRNVPDGYLCNRYSKTSAEFYLYSYR